MTWFEVPLDRGSHRFRTTRWSVVAAAGTVDEPGRRALEELCTQFWPPLYAFARGRGCDPDAALDATQGFFVELLTGSILERADPARGRFRSYLKRCFANYLETERERSETQKRGGQLSIVSLDATTAEDRYGFEPVDEVSADRVFERRWALAVIDAAIARLEGEYAARGRGAIFDGLRIYLEGERPDTPYRDQAAALGLTEGAVRVAVHRMRQRLAELLLEEVGQTLAEGADARGELEELLAALADGKSAGGP